MLNPAQIRAARALLDITQAELASRAGISKTGLNNIERGTADPKASTLTAIQRALEEAGVAFTNGSEPGVKLRPFRVGDWVRLIRGTLMWGETQFSDVRDQPAQIAALVNDGTSMERITVRWENGLQVDGVSPGLFQRSAKAG